jgi:Tfp pilus assembly protein PilO
MIRNYKIITGFLAAVVVATVLFHWTIVRPRLEDVEYDEDIVEQNLDRMRRRGWPTHAASLENRLAQERQEMAELKKQAGELMQRLDRTFADEIIKAFGTPETFRIHASRLDFEELFAELDEQFKPLGIRATPESLGLDTASNLVYPLILQLWTFRDLVVIANESGLAFELHALQTETDGGAPKNAEAEEKQPVSSIRFAPVKAYTRQVEDGVPEPFLLEFSVRLSMTGAVEDVARFMQRMHGDDHLYSISRIEIQTVPPTRNSPKTDTVLARLECSSFYLLKHDLDSIGL